MKVRHIVFVGATGLITILLLLTLLVLKRGWDDRGMDTSNRTVITMGVWSQAQYEAIQPTVKRFNHAQSEHYVELQRYYDMTVGVSQDEGRAQMRQLLADGVTSDLYYLTGMDADVLRSYLADWYPVIEADTAFDPAQYQTQAWRAIEQNGQLIELFTGFTLFGMALPASTVGETEVWTLERMRTLMEENPALFHETATQNQIFSALFLSGYYQEFVDYTAKTCRFDAPEFVELLEWLRALPTSEEVAREPGNLDATWTNNNGVISYMLDQMGYGLDIRYIGYLSAPTITPMDGYGLSNTTAHPESCWAFIKFLLHKTIQQESCTGTTVGGFTAIPMNMELWNWLLEQGRLSTADENSLLHGAIMRDSVPPEVEYHPGMREEDIAYLNRLLAADRASSVMTSPVERILFEYIGIDTLNDESLTAEDIAQRIQADVSAYLASLS